jgi:hypothetical protein
MNLYKHQQQEIVQKKQGTSGITACIPGEAADKNIHFLSAKFILT